ncbi:maleylpyruvate isomerase N-terminal domain-containing protein [Pararhodobacter aggregans]|uniref:maleylpyruvate isomerase N-terminal domain-containing protein n=1 Tax=Pararhodobacter aggregans TaxID=404875 RepID=UPI000D44718A|nr:maleylpyruvate isomerase N-terminal domain-containing protein [Pararhodobacter aggregans]PTX02415.1 maleylpyruvate isomerase [Pararhodobacter aggregans]
MTDPARQALIERQGAGARYDAPGAPAGDLLQARRLTAQVARLLNDTPDAALYRPDQPSLGWRIALLSLEARRMGEAIAAHRAGQGVPSLVPDPAEVDFAAHLPPRALRHLFDHSRIHLNVEWREMSDADWAAWMVPGDGPPVVLADLPRLRAEALAKVSAAFLAASRG